MKYTSQRNASITLIETLQIEDVRYTSTYILDQ